MRKFSVITIFLGILIAATVFVREGLAAVWIEPSPPNESGPAPIFSPSLSRLTVPISIRLSDLNKLVNENAPTGFSGTERQYIKARVRPHVVWHGIHSHIEFDEVSQEVSHVDWQVDRGPIGLNSANDRISIQAPVHGHAKLIPGSVDGHANGTAHGSSTLEIRPDYTLNPAVGLTVDLDHADIAGISIKGLAQGKANEAINAVKGKVSDAVAKAVNFARQRRKSLVTIAPQRSDSWPGQHLAHN